MNAPKKSHKKTVVPSIVKNPKQPLDDSRVKELEHKNIRLLADIDNLHKQHSLDVERYKKTGKRQVLDPVLHFLNTLNIAFAYKPDSADEKVLSFINALQTSFDKMVEDLNHQGIELIKPEIGDAFDANLMQSLTPASGKSAKVTNIVNIGLKMDGQLITPAMVML